MRRFDCRSLIQTFGLVAIMLVLVKTGMATTAVMLSDEQLITSSRVILYGEVKSVKAQWDSKHETINTYVKVRISAVLKGQLQNEEIVFKQLGGTVGDTSALIFGAPLYKAGQSILLFLDTANDGTLRIAHLFQGKYDIIEDPATRQLRVNRKIDSMVNILGPHEGPDITNEASLNKLTKKIKKILRDKAAEANEYEVRRQDVPLAEIPPEYIDDSSDAAQPGDFSAQYTFLGPCRWFQPDSQQPVTYRLNQASAPIAGGGVNEINQALAAWTNVQSTSLVLQNIGSTTASGFRQDGVTAISFNDPLDQMSDPVGCSGTLAIGGPSSFGGPTRIIGGQSFSQIFEGDVVFNRNFSCFLGISANLAEVATHEIGHSIGFDHSADINAIMYASARGNGRGATLGTDDIAAVSFLYPGTKSTPYQGFHDGAGCNTISGWAWNPNSPATTVSVDIYDGNTLIGSAAANMYREDLLNALGSPSHGFSFPTPAALKNGAVHTINVKFSGTSTLLTNTSRAVQCGFAPSYNGRHDGQGCNAIEGWAWDANNPGGTVNVDIYDGTTLIGTVAATLYRQDLADVLGSPYHGFIFHTPASLRNGQPHTVTVKFGGTNVNLPLNTPRTTSCTSGTTNFQGNHAVADCNWISGYAWDANDDQGTINVAIYVDGSFYVVVPAQQAYPGVGSGYHGFKFAVPASWKNGQPHSIQVKFSGTATSLTSSPRTINCSG